MVQSTSQKHYSDQGSDTVWNFVRPHFTGKPSLASQNVCCFLRLRIFERNLEFVLNFLHFISSIRNGKVQDGIISKINLLLFYSQLVSFMLLLFRALGTAAKALPILFCFAYSLTTSERNSDFVVCDLHHGISIRRRIHCLRVQNSL